MRLNYIPLALFVVGFIQCNQPHEKNIAKPDLGLDTTISDVNLIKDTLELRTRADLLYGNKQYKEALDIYNHLVSLDSTNGHFYYIIGYCLGQFDDLQKESVEFFLKAASLNYERADAYHNIAVIYEVLYHDHAKAVIYYKKCLELDPNNQEVKDLIAKFEPKVELL